MRILYIGTLKRIMVYGGLHVKLATHPTCGCLELAASNEIPHGLPPRTFPT